MATRATASVTLAWSAGIVATTRYYQLAAPTAATPAVPTSSSSLGSWTEAEPAADVTKVLWTCERTVYADGTESWSKASKSTSYEAAKDAKGTATDAQAKAAALSTLIRQTDAGVEVGKSTDGKTYTTNRALMSSAGAFQVLDKDGAVLANFDEDSVDLGGTTSRVTLNGGAASIATGPHLFDESDGVTAASAYTDAATVIDGKNIIISTTQDKYAPPHDGSSTWSSVAMRTRNRERAVAATSSDSGEKWESKVFTRAHWASISSTMQNFDQTRVSHAEVIVDNGAANGHKSFVNILGDLVMANWTSVSLMYSEVVFKNWAQPMAHDVVTTGSNLSSFDFLDVVCKTNDGDQAFTRVYAPAAGNTTFVVSAAGADGASDPSMWIKSKRFKIKSEHRIDCVGDGGDTPWKRGEGTLTNHVSTIGMANNDVINICEIVGWRYVTGVDGSTLH